MTAAIVTALFFVAYLGAVVGIHATCNRIWPSKGAPQGRALQVVLGTALAFFCGAAAAVFRFGEDWLWLPYLGVCLLCLAYCYWSLICLSESGRRYRIADLVHSGEATTKEEILRLYDRDAVVRERLARLLQWNEIRMENGRYYSNGGRMYRASVLVHAWARLLGFKWMP